MQSTEMLTASVRHIDSHRPFFRHIVGVGQVALLLVRDVKKNTDAWHGKELAEGMKG